MNKKYWKSMTSEELSSYIDEIFLNYRKCGFPYFSETADYRQKEFKKLLKWRDSYNKPVSPDIPQIMTGLGLCWSYFNFAFDIKCNDKMTPVEVFNNDTLLRKVIEKRLKFGDNMSDNGIRKTLKIFTGAQAVSMFRPTAAYLIYQYLIENYLDNKTDISVYDPSGGFGGRLLGAILHSNIKNYTCAEPSTKANLGLKSICRDFEPVWKDNINLIGSEDFQSNSKFDIVFTSPPYYNTENYADEITQSCHKFKTKQDWLDNFFTKTVDNCYGVMSKGSVIAINIANVPSYSNLLSDARDVLSSKFKIQPEMRLALSSISAKSKFKYEPILVGVKL